ncbi:hypothetical protein BKA67DRAFT_672980 [Truncatella angustata]|uniref:Uncharacterized protein n=1 Tax=Truncatella angustata TaxID=152316 RepID=A0A9P8ZZE3_9PEZI|nr:uncharacterized protein BKA67DRAFT_672980 [Truncatella angustata]KAH6657152.1 hypothetical protein BKA67DRAFT_672980 [Truncatella angustata]KAH8197609.1 hypothetical protein TruAng_008241 [Truncatella angustata]
MFSLPDSYNHTPPEGRGLSARWSRAIGAVNNIIERRARMTSETTRLQKRLQEAVSQSWPTRYDSRYREAHVLLTYWADPEDPTFGADKAAEKLGEVFRQFYGFKVQTWLIPVIDHPQQVMAARLTTFVQTYGQTGNLLIFWYGGSAEASGVAMGSTQWLGERWGPRVNSGIVPQILGSGDADVLTLYDCGSSLHGQSVDGRKIFEHIGASSFPFPQVPNFHRAGSFTKSLIRVLNKPEIAADGISVVDVHRKLINLTQRHRAEPGQDEEVSSIYSGEIVTPRPWFSGGVETRPVYCHLSACPPRSAGRPTTIVLSHLGYPPLERFSYMSQGDELEVQLTLTLSKNNLNVERWKNWISQAPAEVDGVSIEVDQANDLS